MVKKKLKKKLIGKFNKYSMYDKITRERKAANCQTVQARNRIIVLLFLIIY